MRIMTYKGRHDYYDHAMAYGTDEKIVYVRHPKEFHLDQVFKGREIRQYYRELNHWLPQDIRASVLGFCGTLYPVYRYEDTYGMSPEYLLGKQKDDARRRLEALLNKHVLSPWNYKDALLKDRMVKEMIGKELGIETFNKLRSPCFHMQMEFGRTGFQYTLTTNPILVELGFQVIEEPMYCYQEIYMFIDNLNASIGPVDESTKSDDVIAKSKGHDPKTSFRTNSPGKKARRRSK
jgi:hypothetical protein